MTNIAIKIKELRKIHSMTQDELAEKLGVGQSCVSKWERGATVPDANQLVALAKCFDVSTDYLLGLSEI